MTLSKRFSLAVAALTLAVLVGASSAYAQAVSFNTFTAPTFVANTGLSEALGQVSLTADATCGTGADGFCVSIAGTIQVLYVGTDIDITSAPPVSVTSTIVGYVGTISVTNTAAGGVVAFSVNGAIDVAAGQQVLISGARGVIAESPASVVGTAIVGQLTASPSTIAGFSPTSEVVARSADPLEVEIDGGTLIQCQPLVTITVTITEGFNTAFVDHGFPVAPLNPRPLDGATNNTEIRIALTDLPAGVTVNWPATINDDDSPADPDATLVLEDQSVSGDEATYSYQTTDQGASDNIAEEFVITLTDADIDLTGDSTDFGSSTGQAQMFPDDTDDTDAPRFDHPLENDPGDDFLTVGPCTTNLLFPWVANFAGFDTGIAIANTSSDPYGTEPQTGTCEVNLFPTSTTTSNGVAAGSAITITTSPVEPGSVWRSTLSGIPTFAGKAGYIISICQFQYGHGFGFFTDNFGVGAAATAQGYLALIIPDPEITTCERSATPDGAVLTYNGVSLVCGRPTGEGLGQ